MSSEYERLMRDYQVPPGVLSPEELKLLHQGGIRVDDSDEEDDYRGTHSFNRQTQIRNPGSKGPAPSQFDAYKQIYQNELSKKQKQIWYLQNETAHRQKVWEAERMRLDQQYQLELQKVLAQLRRARAQVVHSQGQIPLIKQALQRVRQMLSGMQSQSVYLRIKDLPERDLPPSQWLLVNVWQLIYPYKKQSEYTKKQLLKLREQYKILNDKQHSLLTQLDHYQRLLNSKDDDQKRHALNFDNNKKCLQLQIDKLREQCQLLREKGARYDQLHRDYQFTKQEKQLLQQKLDYYDKSSQKDTGTAKMGHEEAQRRKVDLLTQDKQYLTKQNIQLIEKVRRYQDRLDRLQGQLLNQKNRSQELFTKLLSMTQSNASVTQQKILRQVSQLKDKHQYQLQMAKNNLVDIYEKQIRFLREAIDQKQLKTQTLQRELREKSRENQQLVIETRSFQRKFDSDLSQARLSLKIKSQQLDRINNIYQETLGNLNSHKLQNQMLHQKLNVAKGQIYQQQAHNKDQLSSLKAQVAVLREQLANYQLIQKQIDEAVISLGRLNPNDNQIFTNTLASVPSSSKRRVQQALGLAQRLQAKQRQHQETLELLRNKQKQLQQAEEQLKVARTLLDKTNQPYSYLVSNIQEKQKQIMSLRKENKKMDQDYHNMREQYRTMSRQLEQAQRDIQRLLLKRESIQNIQRILIDLTRGPTTSQQITGAIQEIREILGSTQNQRSMQEAQKKTSGDGVPQWYKKLAEKKGR